MSRLEATGSGGRTNTTVDPLVLEPLSIPHKFLAVDWLVDVLTTSWVSLGEDPVTTEI